MTERLEDLGVGDLKILQDGDGYCFTSDAVVLANFATAKKTDIVVELGSGSGVISLLIAYKENPKHVYGFEIQEKVYQRAIKSVKISGLEDKITFFNNDLALAPKMLSNVNVVVCNPPYKKSNGGLLPQNQEAAISKAEIATNLDLIIASAKALLVDNGRFYVCQTPSRTVELLFKLKNNNLEPKTMFFTQPSIDSIPSCVFVECVKNGNEEIKVLPPLITHNDKGDYVWVVRNLFRKG